MFRILCQILAEMQKTRVWHFYSRLVLSAKPVTKESAKISDWYACLPGHAQQQADAEQAYIQADMRGCETWVSLLDWQECPDAFPGDVVKDMRRPVVPMNKALYGHPKAGLYWEKHCDERLRKVGFEPIPECSSMYKHHDLEVMLSVRSTI